MFVVGGVLFLIASVRGCDRVFSWVVRVFWCDIVITAAKRELSDV